MAEPPRTRQCTYVRPNETDNKVARQEVAESTALRSANPHRYGGSRKKAIELSNDVDTTTLLMQDIATIAIPASKKEEGGFR